MSKQAETNCSSIFRLFYLFIFNKNLIIPILHYHLLQGTLTERDGFVHLTSLYYLV
jgi:hypothetical protein